MTNLYPNSSMQNTAGATAANASGAGGGNPQESQLQPFGVQPPQPINGISTSGASAPAQMSNGQIPVHTQPTNIAVAAGLDSLMAQMSRGQLSLNQSNYGQPGALCPNPNGPAPQGAPVVPVVTGFAAAILIPTPPVYTGT
jgi:hypothetical protein